MATAAIYIYIYIYFCIMNERIMTSEEMRDRQVLQQRSDNLVQLVRCVDIEADEHDI